MAGPQERPHAAYPYAPGLLARDRGRAAARAFGAAASRLKLLTSDDSGYVIDVGSGPGYTASTCRRSCPGASWLLVDMDAHLLAERPDANDRAICADADYVPALLTRISRPTVVIASHVAYYIENFPHWVRRCLESAIAECRILVVVRSQQSDSFRLRSEACTALGVPGHMPLHAGQVIRELRCAAGAEVTIRGSYDYNTDLDLSDRESMRAILSFYSHVAASVLDDNLTTRLLAVLQTDYPTAAVHHSDIIVEIAGTIR